MKNAALWGMVVVLSACAPQSKVSAPPQAPAARPPAPAVPAPAPVPAPPASPGVEAYKAAVASEIWTRSAEVYSEPIPEMLKSIVVVEISIDRAGNPIDLYVVRSNGFKHLELRALESVVRAAPFPPPAPGVLEGPGCVTFLETFLFRDDGRFQLRSLVPSSQRVWSTSAGAR